NIAINDGASAYEQTAARDAVAKANRDQAAASVVSRRAGMSDFGRFTASLAMGIADTGSFLSNLGTLRRRGFGDLADQLLQMGGPDAGKSAGEAVRQGAGTLSGVNRQVQRAIAQQKALSGQDKALQSLPARLALRGAVKSGETYAALVGSGQFSDADLAAAAAAMSGELSKTARGRSILAAVHGDTDAALRGSMRGYSDAAVPVKVAAGYSAPPPWMHKAVAANAGHLQITVKGEGVISNMIEATVDGRLVTVSRAVSHGQRVG